MRKTFLILALLAATAARAQNNVVVTVTAEMGGTYAGGALKATNIVPGGNASTSLAFFFNSSGTVSAGLPSNGTWLFDFCNSSNICFSAQVQLPGANSFDATSIFTSASSGSVAGVSSVTNSDGTLTISPTTGPVVASLNLSHANNWSALQAFPVADISIGGVTPSGTSGTGNLIFGTSPILTTPNLGTPSAINLSNATALPCAALPAETGDTTHPAGSCATTTSALNGVAIPVSAVVIGTNSSGQPLASSTTGTGSVVVLGTSPTLITPALGTPSAINLTNATGLPCGALPAFTGDVTSAGATCTTSVVNVNGAVIPTSAVVLGSNASKQIIAATTTGSGAAVLATSPTLVTPALGTPSAIVLTNATGLPCGALPALTGDTTTSAGSCATTTAKINGTAFPASATVIGSNSSSQPIAATTTGTGTTVVLATSPTLVTPALGTPSALVLTNATGLPVAGGGTGLATLTSNVIYKGNGTSAMSVSSMTDNGTSVTSSDTGGYVAPVFQANGTTAGFFDFPQGTTSAAVAPCNTATSACFQAPTAVTSYVADVPAAAPVNNNSAWLFSNANPSIGTFAKMQQTAITSGSAYTNATTGFTSVVGSSGQTLSFSVEASTNYVMNCQILWSASAATAGPKFQFTGPASPTAVQYSVTTGVTATTTGDAGATAFSTSLNASGATVTASTLIPSELSLGLVNGTTAGTVTLQAAAQGTGTLTIEPGSYCTLQ